MVAGKNLGGVVQSRTKAARKGLLDELGERGEAVRREEDSSSSGTTEAARTFQQGKCGRGIDQGKSKPLYQRIAESSQEVGAAFTH